MPTTTTNPTITITPRDRYVGCLLGLAIGDAIGTTVEFLPPSKFTPLTDGGSQAIRREARAAAEIQEVRRLAHAHFIACNVSTNSGRMTHA